MPPADRRLNTALIHPRLLFLGAALLTGCTSSSSHGEAPKSTYSEALTQEARAIVSVVVAETPLAELCAGGPPAVRAAVRHATIRAMMAGELEQP
ncbi:MAG: hypothetical protein D6807_00085, partial [Alphaproteobacteria bacterium]